MYKQYRVLKPNETMQAGDIAIMLTEVGNTFWHSISAMTIAGMAGENVGNFTQSYGDGPGEIVIREIKSKKGTQNAKQDL